MERIENFLENIQWLFQIQNYDRKFSILKADDGEKKAEIHYDEEYQTIKISLYPLFFKSKLEDQRKILLHELCHTLTLPQKILFFDFIDGTKTATKDQSIFLNERETSQIENIIDGLLQGKFTYAKKAYRDFIKVKKVKKKKKK